MQTNIKKWGSYGDIINISAFRVGVTVCVYCVEEDHLSLLLRSQYPSASNAL